jgi:2,4-dienoyl-CoA reductase-like NADH-dependent reductase (Old Yellow Enzyme family)
MVDRKYKGDPGDVAVNPSRKTELLSKWKAYASTCRSNDTPIIMQINHPGRQSPAGAGSRSFLAKNIAPSAIPLNMGPGLLARFASAFVFGTPREMNQADIDSVVQQFVECSQLAAEAGFHGVQIHAAHGYLLTQFLTAETNHRTDAYGGTPEKRAKIVIDIINAVRAAAPEGFCVGIKLNSVDHQSPEALEGCITQLKMIIEAGVDFVEISGGDYEDVKVQRSPSYFWYTRLMVEQFIEGNGQSQQPKSEHTLAREAFFLEFANAIRSQVPEVPLMLTGGFRTRRGMVAAMQDNSCDLIGLARPAVLAPSLPKSIILNEEISDEDAKLPFKSITAPWLIRWSGIKVLSSGAEPVSTPLYLRINLL